MALISPSSLKCVGEDRKCNYCNGDLIKHGTTKGGNKTRYRCKSCKRTQVSDYTYAAYNKDLNTHIVSLLKEGVGIRSMARLLSMSQNTVLSRIKEIAATIEEPILSIGKEYEVDELCTFIKKKECLTWVAIALRRDTREVVRFAVGSRTKKTLQKVTEPLLLSQARRIFTDKLRHYLGLIASQVHSTQTKATNHIERLNLTLRTHLKRLCRRSICYSRQELMLTNVLKIYFWEEC